MDLYQVFIAPLEEAGIRYMISGSVASIFYGEPRMTADIDLGLFLRPHDALTIQECFPPDAYYCPPLDVLQIETSKVQRGHFNLIHLESGLKADAYPSRDHLLYQWAWGHLRRGNLFSGEAWFAPPEYVIAWKLEFYREAGSEKHLRDIAGILSVQGKNLDHELIQETIRELRLQNEWQKAVDLAS